MKDLEAKLRGRFPDRDVLDELVFQLAEVFRASHSGGGPAEVKRGHWLRRPCHVGCKSPWNQARALIDEYVGRGAP